jgi:drug/metabolite transporter (DMT)-like permease
MKKYDLLLKKHHLMLKTMVASVVVMATNCFGNYALKRGLNDGAGVAATWAPLQYIRAFGHLWVMAGVLLLLGWFVSRLVLLSWADLSYVLPVTSFSYVLSAALGAVWLHEKVRRLDWGGIWLITIGVAFTVFTRPGTTPSGSESE